MVRHLLLALFLFTAVPPAQGAAMPAPIVFFDIAGLDAHKQAAFYHEVFGWIVGPGGTLSIPISTQSLGGALRQDPADKIIYLGVADVTAALADVAEHGAK